MSTTTTPASTPAPPASSDVFKDVRSGTSAVLFVLGGFALCVALYFLAFAQSLASTPEIVAESWTAGFADRTIWPVFLWTTLLAVIGLGGGVIVQAGGKGNESAQTLGKQLAFIQFAFAVAMGLVPAYLKTLYTLEVAFGPVFIWASFLATTLVAGGVWTTYHARHDPIRFRITLMAVGGAVGLITVLLGFTLPLTVYYGPLSKGLEEWRKNWPAVLWPSVATLGGLGLMFASLQLGRGMERQNQNVRRLIYGYNAVLTGLLLIAILALPNVLAYAEPFVRFFGRPFDWTATNLNALAPDMRNTLANLREPIKVYAILSPYRLETQDTKTLLENCQSISNYFKSEFVPVDRSNLTKIRGLMDRYSLADPDGLLVIAGSETEGSTRPDFAFVRSSELSENLGGGQRSIASYSYVGANALRNAILSLVEGKMTIYFTQGHGELKLDSAPMPKMPGMMPPQRGEVLSRLKGRLTSRKNVEVKPLELTADTREIPKDASVVVVARPNRAFLPSEAKVLSAYARRDRVTQKSKDKNGKETEEETVTAGRLLLLLEPIITTQGRDKAFVKTGLEELLMSNNVALGSNRVLSALSAMRNPNGPGFLICWSPENSANPIAKAFHRFPEEFTTFAFENARTVAALNPQGPKTIDTLIETIDPVYWVEKDPAMNADEMAAKIRNSRQLAAQLVQKSVTIGVAVSDSGSPPGMPRDAAHGGLVEGTPRMVVFGTSSWITDMFLQNSQVGEGNLDLFNSCVSWLRGKSGLGSSKIPGTKREVYTLNVKESELSRLQYLPLGLILLSVVGLGTSVWIVRRR